MKSSKIILSAVLVFVLSCTKTGTDVITPVTPPQPEPQKDTTAIADTSTVYGRVFCSDKPVVGVAVTDGYKVVLTDSLGLYQFNSLKKNKMVWISIPTGYTVSRVGVIPQFFKVLTKDNKTAEQADFELFEDGSQENHTMLIFGDIHLANRRNEGNQFKTFTNDVNAFLTDHKDEKVYAMTLGDMTWDAYWYSNNFSFAQYLDAVKDIKGLSIFHTIGNHDHDMVTTVDGTLSGWDAVDWDTAGAYRKYIGPNYYSFNIGDVHYIALDNIYCQNTTGGTTSDRHYAQTVSADNINWLKKDLSLVDKNAAVVVTMHAQLHKQTGANDLTNAAELKQLFAGFRYVRFVTGHTHKMWTVNDGNVHEHNSGAVCAAWWWAGSNYPTLNVAEDGAPGGYRVMEFKKGYETSYYKGTGRLASYQFRSYDRNSINMTPSSLGITTYADEFNTYMSKYGGYNSASTENKILINVWDYNAYWKVEASEDNVNFTKCTQVKNTYDPMYLLAYTAPVFKKSGKDPSFYPYKTYHLFSYTASSAKSTVYIRVTDDEGRQYSEVMTRPKAFTADNYK